MYTIFLCFLIFFASKATPTLFDHATKNYTNYLSQSPEKAQLVQTMVNAEQVIKKVTVKTDQKEADDTKENEQSECDEKTFDELRLICSKAGAPFLENINPKTAVGMVSLIKILTNPTTNTSELKKRQAIIEILGKNPELLATLAKLLAEFKQDELIVVQELNQDATAIPSLFQRCKNSLFEAVSFLFALENFLKIISIDNDCRTGLLGTEGARFTNPEGFNRNWEKLKNHRFVIPLIFKFSPDNPVSTLERLNILSPRSWGFLYLTLDTYKAIFIPFNYLKSLHKSFINHQTKQRAYKKLLMAYQAIITSQDYLPIELPQKNASQPLVNQLKKSTYKSNKVSLFANPYTIYRTKKLIEQNQSFLRDIYCVIGQIDAYSGLAQLLQDQQCHFAHYIENKRPLLNIIGGIHPNILNAQNSIRNDFIHNDDTKKQIIVISGKNASGKSFNTKMLLLNAWLAQTISFTLTKEACIITPFSYFKIHANISDSDHYSKFETEKNELAQLLKKIRLLEQKEKKSIVVFDEPLSTTSAVHGEPLVNALLSVIKNNNQSLSFIITHLYAILANQGARQMSIKVMQNADRTFTSTRKFQEGPSYDNDAGVFLAQALDPELREQFLKAYDTELKEAEQKKESQKKP